MFADIGTMLKNASVFHESMITYEFPIDIYLIIRVLNLDGGRSYDWCFSLPL
jgi:hypothetical protein